MFWLARMEAGLPEFKPDEEGNRVLGGAYGTRFVEYLTARRFEEEDRMPEVMSAHINQVMQQMWATAVTLGTVRPASPWQPDQRLPLRLLVELVLGTGVGTWPSHNRSRGFPAVALPPAVGAWGSADSCVPSCWSDRVRFDRQTARG